jgi:hypothetical protein
LFIEVHVVIVTIFNSARRFVQRQHGLAKLRREERRCLSIADFHENQENLAFEQRIADTFEPVVPFGPVVTFGPHFYRRMAMLALAERARAEQEMLRTGKTYWQLHDLDAYARKVLAIRTDEIDDFWSSLPTSAIAPLCERITALHRQHDHTRWQPAPA